MGDEVIRYEGEDPDMIQAMEEARKTFKFFWRELSWESRRIVPAFDMTMVKHGFPTDSATPDSCSVEHMWISEIAFDGLRVRGVLMNQPNWISDLNEGAAVEFPFSEVEDWMIMYDDKAYGGWTVQAMRKKMSKAERKGHDEAWGLDFGDPDRPRILIEGKEEKTGFLSKLFGSKRSGSAIDFDDPPEHPMSDQMAEKITEGVKADPETAFGRDPEGWTMLHWEALAGNATPVKILIEHGADVAQKNDNGHTPLDLARMMVWPRVIQALEQASKS